jgi:hypothetical protein
VHNRRAATHTLYKSKIEQLTKRNKMAAANSIGPYDLLPYIRKQAIANKQAILFVICACTVITSIPRATL